MNFYFCNIDILIDVHVTRNFIIYVECKVLISREIIALTWDGPLSRSQIKLNFFFLIKAA